MGLFSLPQENKLDHYRIKLNGLKTELVRTHHASFKHNRAINELLTLADTDIANIKLARRRHDKLAEIQFLEDFKMRYGVLEHYYNLELTHKEKLNKQKTQKMISAYKKRELQITKEKASKRHIL